MNRNAIKIRFSLSDASRTAGTATPAADRREYRSSLAWLPLFVLAAVVVGVFGGLPAAIATAAAGFSIWLVFCRKKSQRRHELWKSPFPPEHEQFLLRRIVHYRCLDESGRELFRQRVKLFLDGVVFHGAGVKVKDGLRLRAAAAAVVPTLGFDEWEWSRLKEIIFRPEGYEHGGYQDEDGLVTEYEESGMIGESGIMSGVMMLSSQDLVWEFAHPEEGANVGFHEFAHLMAVQGLMLAEEDRGEWEDLMVSEGAKVRRDESLLDEYALLNQDEFFAVASELFFTVPRRFRSWHRKLYTVLARCYRQDPASWLDSGEPEPDSSPRRRRRGTPRKRQILSHDVLPANAKLGKEHDYGMEDNNHA